MSVVKVGIVTDHSVSMRPLTMGAKKDYNTVLESLKDNNETVYLSHVECGRLNVLSRTAKVRTDFIGVPVKNVSTMHNYEVDGQSTPLWDSVDKAIDCLENQGGYADSYLVMVITDGQENSSVVYLGDLKKRIQRLQATDRWTFVFRVPVGYSKHLISLGVPAGNIIEWEQTEQALAVSTSQTVNATRSYFSNVSKGITSTNRFYADLSDVKPADLRRELDDITDSVHMEPVWDRDDGTQIRDFCVKTFGEYVIGRAYYQLTKPEKVQAGKGIVIKHKKKGKYYTSDPSSVRDFLGLPRGMEIKLAPNDHPDYEIYVKSTSVNRKLVAHTKVLYV